MRINHPTKNANDLGPAWQNIAVKRQKENGLELFRSRRHFEEIKQPKTLLKSDAKWRALHFKKGRINVCYDLSVQYKMQKFTFALSKRFRPKHNVPVRENKLFIGTGSILAGDKSCVLPTEPHLLKKKCPWTQSMTGGPWTQSMKVVHGPSPKWVHVLSSPVLTILCILSIINVSLCLCVFKINQIAGRFIVLF